MTGPEHPTLRTLAEKAGVSHTTVSLALRNSPSISPAMRKRIQKLARDQGYESNPLVSAVFSRIRSRKPRGNHAVIAYLNTWWPKAAWESCNTKTGQFRGAARRAAELGFRLENFWLGEPGMSPARLGQILRARGIRGIVVGPLQNQELVLDFPWEQFALAAIGYSLHSPAVARATHAHFRGMCRAMDGLISHGYRRIGYVTSKDFEERVSSLWGAAYSYHQHRLVAKDRISPLVFDGEAELASLRRWLSRSRPDAIINALPDVYELVTGLGLKAPRDLGFVHLDLPLHLRQAGVSGVDQLSETVGAYALELVASQIYIDASGVPEHPVTQLVEGVWIDGRTIAPQAKRSQEDRAPAFAGLDC